MSDQRLSNLETEIKKLCKGQGDTYTIVLEIQKGLETDKYGNKGLADRLSDAEAETKETRKIVDRAIYKVSGAAVIISIVIGYAIQVLK